MLHGFNTSGENEKSATIIEPIETDENNSKKLSKICASILKLHTHTHTHTIKNRKTATLC